MSQITDMMPDERNRVAYWLGRLLHPVVICIPTLLLVLNELSWSEALSWSLLLLPILLLPAIVMTLLLRRRGRLTHQRLTRTPIYLTAWISILVCLLLIVGLNAPRVLAACFAALAVWVPVQLLINRYITKISTHTAVAAGCATGLLLLGRLSNPIVLLLVIGLVISLMWARITTRNHTPLQVAMGLVVGGVSVALVFPFILRA